MLGRALQAFEVVFLGDVGMTEAVVALAGVEQQPGIAWLQGQGQLEALQGRVVLPLREQANAVVIVRLGSLAGRSRGTAGCNQQKPTEASERPRHRLPPGADDRSSGTKREEESRSAERTLQIENWPLQIAN